jgi:glutathione S-transferase
MNALTLHCHPLSSCCHKVLIAVDVLGIELEWRRLDLGDPAQRAEGLLSAHAVLEHRRQGRRWIGGDGFSLADCAAAPALCYAHTCVPLPTEHLQLAAHFERLLGHASVALTINRARPCFKFYPGREGLSRRFHDPAPR